MQHSEWLEIDVAPGVFADALALDGSVLLFLSLWGRDTAVQELLARLSLPEKEGGIRLLRVGDRQILMTDPERLEKLSGRMPKGNLFGDVTHLWLYDRMLTPKGRNHGRGALLQRAGYPVEPERLWSVVMETSGLPLLPHWRDPLLSECRQRGWIREISGHNVVAVVVDLGTGDAGSDLASVVGDGVRRGQLTLDAPTDPAIAPIRH